MVETTIAGKYRILRLLGEGGMGAVYEAEHTSTQRRLAVKPITLNDPHKKHEVVTRFEREARMAGSLDTEHIVQVIDSGEDTELGMPFMVMEMLQGEDLETLTDREGPLDPDLALRIAAQACIGLRHAHQAKIIHRDIKPANIFLAQRDEGRVVAKILDFGIAKARLDEGMAGNAGKLTRTGSVIGSPYFMSPEQALGEKDIDFRSDIWSLGVVLYTMLAGRTPHDDVESLGQIIMRICSTAAPPVQDFAPWVPAEVAAVVHKSLMLDRKKRFATTSDMLDALRALLPNGIDITTDMLGPLAPEIRANVAPRLAPEDISTAATLAQSAPFSQRTTADAVSRSIDTGDLQSVRSKRLLIGAASLVVIGAVGAAGYSLTRPPVIPSQAAPEQPPAGLSAPEPKPSVAPAASGAVTEEQSVMVDIAPAGAVVYVEGNEVSVEDGKIKLTGALGSVHKVRVKALSTFVEKSVVISESGAIPPKIEVVKQMAAQTKPSSAVSSAPTAVRPPVVKPPKPKPSSTVDKNFDQ